MKTDEEIVYSPTKYRETEGIKDDGDIVLSTDNPYFIKGSHKDHNIITYEKGLAKPDKMTVPNITSTVMKGFGTGVGGFSNTATILYSMAAMFNKPSQKEQHDEIMMRIKLLREIVGQEIDRIKGADKPSLPPEWKKFQQINPDDSPEVKTEKYKKNAMVVSKKPYFFRYLYSSLNQQFKQFEDSYNQVAKDMFGTKIKKLFKKPDITPEERDLVRKYQKYSPLITSDCTMNRLCREFEDVDFDIKFSKDAATDKKKSVVCMLPSYNDIYTDSFSQDKFKAIKELYCTYIGKPQKRHILALFTSSTISITDEEFVELRKTIHKQMIEDLQDKFSSLEMDGSEFLFYCHKLSSYYASFNWGFAWDILDEQILNYIPQGKTYCPIHSFSPEASEYLGNTYELQDISLLDPDVVTEITNSVYGDPSDIIDIGDDMEIISSSDDASQD